MATQSSFPNFCSQGGGILHTFKITGSEVGATQGSSGLDGRGQMLATISDSSNVQTVEFKNTMVDAYIWAQPLTENGAGTLTPTLNGDRVTGFTIEGLERDDNTTSLADQDWFIFVFEYTMKQYVP
jgi:hypothetical protein